MMSCSIRLLSDSVSWVLSFWVLNFWVLNTKLSLPAVFSLGLKNYLSTRNEEFVFSPPYEPGKEVLRKHYDQISIGSVNVNFKESFIRLLDLFLSAQARKPALCVWGRTLSLQTLVKPSSLCSVLETHEKNLSSLHSLQSSQSSHCGWWATTYELAYYINHAWL